MKSAILTILAVACVVATVSGAAVEATPWSVAESARWCLAIEANGENNELGYDSPLWTDSNTYEKNGNRKTKAYFEPFSAIKVQFCEAGVVGKCNSKVTYAYTEFESLLDLVSKVTEHSEAGTEIGMGSAGVDWVNALPGGANYQKDGCKADGVNMMLKSVPPNATVNVNTFQARFGAMWSHDKTCKSGADSVLGIGMKINFQNKDPKISSGMWYAGAGIVRSNPPSRATVARIFVRPKSGSCPTGDPTRHRASTGAFLNKVELNEGSGGTVIMDTQVEPTGEWGRQAYSGVGNLLSSFVTGKFVTSKKAFVSARQPDEFSVDYHFTAPVRVSEWMIEHGQQEKTVSRVQVFADGQDAGTYAVAPANKTDKASEFEVATVRIPPHLQRFASKHTVKFLESTDSSVVTVSRMWPSFRTSPVPWCLAMRVNGASKLLSYNSSYWTSDEQLNDEGNLKTPSFGATPFRAIRVEFCEGAHCNVRDISESDSSLQAWFQRGQANVDVDFKSVMPLGNNVQPHCNKVGRNLQESATVRARLGVIMSNKENNCNEIDSVIGVGIDASAYPAKSARQISAGNWVGCCASTEYPVPTHPAIVNIYVNPQDRKSVV